MRLYRILSERRLIVSSVDRRSRLPLPSRVRPSARLWDVQEEEVEEEVEAEVAPPQETRNGAPGLTVFEGGAVREVQLQRRDQVTLLQRQKEVSVKLGPVLQEEEKTHDCHAHPNRAAGGGQGVSGRQSTQGHKSGSHEVGFCHRWHLGNVHSEPKGSDDVVGGRKETQRAHSLRPFPSDASSRNNVTTAPISQSARKASGHVCGRPPPAPNLPLLVSVRTRRQPLRLGIPVPHPSTGALRLRQCSYFLGWRWNLAREWRGRQARLAVELVRRIERGGTAGDLSRCKGTLGEKLHAVW